MSDAPAELLRLREFPRLDDGVLLLAFTGWMDGGEVSTGTVHRLVELLDARPFAELDPEPFYIFNFPGSMDVAAIFRPHIEIEEGLLKRLAMPSNVFYAPPSGNLILFVGTEPNLRWRTYRDLLVRVARETGVRRVLFVGSFGGSVPHTRQPRLFVTVSDPRLLPEMEQYAVRRTGYEGPGSFTSYLLQQAPAAGLEMVSLAAEIPGYLQGPNPVCIEAVTRRLAKLLRLQLDLTELRTASTEWELRVSAAVDEDAELAPRVRELETRYDTDLLERSGEG